MAEGEGGAGGAGQPDAALLAPLSEDTFLHNLHVRYKRDIIYTYVGNALVSVNPCRALPLYSAELVRAYLARPPYALPPHVYALAAAAYRRVRDAGQSQCIVVTGESGAGKTEAARVCLQAAVVAAPGAAPRAAAALTAAGTLLEAFGNAATPRNHNASRFGKLLEIEFDFKGEPVGGHITHYLLEKERACGVCEGERNFHVLYQLLAGADVPLLKRLKLQRSWEQYRILRGAPPPPADPPRASPRRVPPAPPHAAAQHDTDHFAFTKAAMAALGLGGVEGGAVLRLLAFMLKLGNVHFEPQHNIDGSIGTRIHHLHELREACALVGVDADALAEALAAPQHAPHLPPECERATAEEGPAEEEAEGEGGAEFGGEAGWARAALDRLLGALYSRLFTWLVQRANAALRPARAAAPARAALALLDVYGFESLARNGLERLLINYAAERVQAAVTGATLRREQEEYAREGLPWRPLPYRDHDAAADLLDAGPDSVLGALRDAAVRGASDAALLARLQRRRHPRLRVAPPDHFTVAHFAGAVTYCARGMVCKNRDALCRRCGGVLGGARDALLAELFAAEGAAAAPPPSPRRPAALSCRQRALVAALVRRLPPAPRLVRCLRADAMLRPHRFDAQLLRHQIRTQGILEMALLRRAGWCESMCARGTVARYGLLAGRGAPPPEEPVRAARALLRALPIPSAEFAYGRTRVFIRSPRTVSADTSVGAGGSASGARGGAGGGGAASVASPPRAAAARRGRRASAGVAGARGPAQRARVAARRARRLRAGLGGARRVALVVRGGAPPLPVRAVGAAAGAPPLARVHRVAAAAGAAPPRADGCAAAATAPRVALPRVPRRVRPDGAEPHAREGDRERAVPRAQGDVRRERGAPVRGGLRAAARVGRVAARRRRGARPVRRVRRRGRQGGARVRARGALPVRRVDGGAAAAGGALAAREAARAGAPRVPAVAVPARRRRAGGARAPAAAAARLRAARRAGRARLPVRGRGRAAAARRRGGAHVPRARAGHQAVPRGAERRGRAAAGHGRHGVRGELRLVGGDGRLPLAGRARRGGGGRGRAPAAPRRPHGRAALSAHPAVFALSAHRAVFALSAHPAVFALSAHPAVFALSAHPAVFALSAHPAVFALSAHRAVFALSAHRAVFALSAHPAVFALSAHRAVFALSAHPAVFALSAHPAVFALSAHPAVFALSAHTAVFIRP